MMFFPIGSPMICLSVLVVMTPASFIVFERELTGLFSRFRSSSVTRRMLQRLTAPARRLSRREVEQPDVAADPFVRDGGAVSAYLGVPRP